jgi:hypothetical protein
MAGPQRKNRERAERATAAGQVATEKGTASNEVTILALIELTSVAAARVGGLLRDEAIRLRQTNKLPSDIASGKRPDVAPVRPPIASAKGQRRLRDGATPP